ncbi:MAG TPA: hypothetical protein VJ019_00720, partial [Aestuariivirga sp.]|nr:hypothetical protein [Aestuariivirga sp.]
MTADYVCQSVFPEIWKYKRARGRRMQAVSLSGFPFWIRRRLPGRSKGPKTKVLNASKLIPVNTTDAGLNILTLWSREK